MEKPGVFSIGADFEWQVIGMEKYVLCSTCVREHTCLRVTPQVTHAHHVIILITRRAVDLHDTLVDARKISGLLTA